MTLRCNLRGQRYYVIPLSPLLSHSMPQSIPRVFRNLVFNLGSREQVMYVHLVKHHTSKDMLLGLKKSSANFDTIALKCPRRWKQNDTKLVRNMLETRTAQILQKVVLTRKKVWCNRHGQLELGAILLVLCNCVSYPMCAGPQALEQVGLLYLHKFNCWNVCVIPIYLPLAGNEPPVQTLAVTSQLLSPECLGPGHRCDIWFKAILWKASWGGLKGSLPWSLHSLQWKCR